MIELKKYQKEAIEIVEDKFNLGLNKTCIIWPTGLGKTIVPIDLMKKYPDKKFLVIAPRHSIISQTKEYMEKNEISKDSAIFYTYSGLSKMSEELMLKLEPDYIILDEMHRAGAKEWGQGIDRLFEMYPKANSLGLTATPTRMDGQNIAEEKFNGDIAHEITLEEAIARGLLKMPKAYINAIYSLDGEIGDIEESISKVKDEEERQKLETKLEAVKRKLQESKGLPEIFAERMSQRNGKYIIFCKDIAHMHEMMEKANEMYRGVNENIEIYDISSEKDNLQNAREIKHFKENKNDSLKLLYSVDMFNEGLHIENAGIIMFRPTESCIVYLQQLGRTLGIEESGEVYDIVNNSRSSKDIYQFCETVKNIQQKEKIEGVKIDFTIYDEVRDIQELLEEIKQSIHIDYFSTEEKIEYLKKLKEEDKEIDLSEVKSRDKTKDGKLIGWWIIGWRVAYKKDKLTEEEIEKITELGIDLETQQLSKAEKIEYLKKLKEEDKKIDLSQIKQKDKTKDEEPIGKWIRNWRVEYKKGKLTEEEIKQITALGIDLKTQVLSNAEKIAKFIKLKEQGEDLSKIKQKDETKAGDSIGIWIRNWRVAYKKGELSEEEIKQITQLGIKLSLRDKQEEKASAEEKRKEAKKLYEKYEELIGENQKS